MSHKNVKWWWVSATVCVVLCASVVWYRWWQHKHAWVTHVKPFEGLSGRSVDFHASAVRLRNELAQKLEWTASDVDELIRYASRESGTVHPVGASNDSMTGEMLEEDTISEYANWVIDDRLGRRGPIQAEDRERLYALILTQCEHPAPRRRQQAVNRLVDSGAVYYRKGRDAMERLKADSDPLVAANAVRKLAVFQERLAKLGGINKTRVPRWDGGGGLAY